MSRNPLASLIGNYGDSDDDSEDESRGVSVTEETTNRSSSAVTPGQNYEYVKASAAIHPPPIPHCPWSACYDETSGYTYYWNQQTNAVTWDAPPEYLLALKLAQQQLNISGSAEVSAEEWQLYQQALAEKQTQAQVKAPVKQLATKINKKNDRNSVGNKDKNNKLNKKRTHSDDEEEKIELITSYHNSDSESNDEAESPVKLVEPPKPKIKSKVPKLNSVYKKPKLKETEHGTTLPKLNYSAPIGPELPPELSSNIAKSPKVNTENAEKEEKPSKPNEEDCQDETTLLNKLKDKAKLLEKLGGEIPKELQKMIEEESSSDCVTPKTDDPAKSNVDVDELLEKIEKNELPKISKRYKTDIFENTESNEQVKSPVNSPDKNSTSTIEFKPLFPSALNIEETPQRAEIENDVKLEVPEKKVTNLYLSDNSERIETGKKKLRISNSVLPPKEPIYTTKYSQFIEGFSNERVGLGFSKEGEYVDSPKNAISYGNGLLFTKGETLNEEKKDEVLDDLTDLLEMKLKYLNQLQPCVLTPVQELLIQMQTLVSAFRGGALSRVYWRQWASRASGELSAHERRAAPPGWHCTFQRSEGRYCYRRESDGLVQWEYPATSHTDMDISTTPPHPGIEDKEETIPPLPPSSPQLRPPSPHTPPPPAWGAPSPATWSDPPPPGCDEPPPLPLTVTPNNITDPKQEIGDELASFYSDIAQLEKTSAPQSATNSPEPVEVKEKHMEQDKEIQKEKERDKERDKERLKEREKEKNREREKERRREREKEKEREKDREGKITKKKSKVKISERIGLKHKSVSSLVAKWQQVAEEIHSE